MRRKESSLEIGTKFEKFVQLVLRYEGIETERNVMFHTKKRRCQADLVSERGFLRRRRIYECKYVNPKDPPRFSRYFVQLAEAMLLTKSEGVLVTNSKVTKKDEKESEYNIVIVDREQLEPYVKDLEKMIRSMPYHPEKDHKYIHIQL